MRPNKMTPQLERELERVITDLENEDKYVQSLFQNIGPQGSSNIDEASSQNADDKQIGTNTPRYFGQIDTFVSNPSSVGLGVMARMMETDPTVLSAVQLKSTMMLSKIGEYYHDDPKIAEFVQDYLAKMYSPTWKEALESQTSFYGYGFSISEIIWGLNKEMKKVPVKVKTYHPTTICFEVDAYGEITEWGIVQFVIQNAQFSNPNNRMPGFQSGFTVKNPFETPEDRLMPYRLPFLNSYGLARIPKNKCIHHVQNNMLSFGSPYGKTAVRTAHLAWQLKVFFIKQMGIAGKRQASPFIWATAPHGANKVRVKGDDGREVDMTPIEALSDILARREGDDSIVTGPTTGPNGAAGYSLQAIAANMDLNQYLAVLLWLDTQIFRAFLLPSLVMTDGAAGSRSLGDKHFEIVDRIAEEEAIVFGKTIIDQMIRQSIVENFGEQDDYGHFAQRPQNLEERERLAGLFATLTSSQYMRATDKKDGDYVRSTLHLPEQDDSFYTQPAPNFEPMDKINKRIRNEDTDNKDDGEKITKPDTEDAP